MDHTNYDYLAVDVAKDSLCTRDDRGAFETTYDERGIMRILKRAAKLARPCVVMEASGGYERSLLARLFAAGIPACRVNPLRVRAFALSEGLKAKTDPLDTALLLRFAREKRLEPQKPPSPQHARLAALLDRRSQVSEFAAREKNRAQNHSGAGDAFIEGSISGMLEAFELQLSQIEAEIRKCIDSDPDLRDRCECLKQICGVGDVTAWSIIAYLPEITELTRNQASAMVGLAPFNKDSGKTRKPRNIHDGRAKIRRSLYMAANSARMHNPVIKAFYDRLRDNGKTHNVAMVAAMRKLLIHIRSQLINLQSCSYA